MYEITPYLGTVFETEKGSGFITATAVINGEQYVQIKTSKEVAWIKFEKEPFDMNICKNHERRTDINRHNYKRKERLGIRK